MVKLVFGCGYLGQRMAQRWMADGDQVRAVTRSNEKASYLARLGIQSVVANIAQPFQLPVDFPVIDTVLYSVGFDPSPGQRILDVYVGGMRHVLESLPGDIQRIVYISSTGVYGETVVGPIDEDSPCQPVRLGAQASLATEQLLAQHPLGSKRIVLRLAGIYGPNRLPKLASVRAGSPIDADPATLVNLIHVDDATEIVRAAERRPRLPVTYVVSDGQPVLRRDFYGEMARLLGAPPPTFLPSPDASQRRSHGNRTIRSDRAWHELGLTPMYPSYREGLAAIIASSPRVPPEH